MSDCTLLEWFDKGFAAKIEPACKQHDEDYHFYRGLLASDWRFIKAMWRACWWRCIVYTPFLLLGGWFLYYDFDKKIERLWK